MNPFSLSKSTLRWIVAAAVFFIGATIFVYGLYLATQNPRTNAEDEFAWLVLAVGTATTAIGLATPFVRNAYIPLVAVLAPPVGFTCAVFLYWACILLHACCQNV